MPKLTIELEVEPTDLRLFEQDETLMHVCATAVRQVLLNAHDKVVFRQSHCDPTPYSHNAHIGPNTD